MNREPIRWRFRDRRWGDSYVIDCVWDEDGDRYRVYCVEHPAMSFPLGFRAMLCPGNEISVSESHAPRTVDRAKALAICWIAGFSASIRTGEFTEPPVRVSPTEASEEA